MCAGNGENCYTSYKWRPDAVYGDFETTLVLHEATLATLNYTHTVAGAVDRQISELGGSLPSGTFTTTRSRQ